MAYELNTTPVSSSASIASTDYLFGAPGPAGTPVSYTFGAVTQYALGYGGSQKVFIGASGTGFGGAASAKVHVIGTGTADARIRLAGSSSAVNYTDITDSGTGALFIATTRDTGSALTEIYPKPADGTSSSVVRFFRYTNTTGPCVIYVVRGDNTATIDAQISAGAATTNYTYFCANGGRFGLGIAAGLSAQLHTTGTVRHANFGAGTAQFDASGNVSSSSSETLKTVDGEFTRSIEALREITPILFHWNERSGMDQLNQYAGFSAQNVQETAPELVGVDDNGDLTLCLRGMLAMAVNAIKNIDARLTAAGY